MYDYGINIVWIICVYQLSIFSNYFVCKSIFYCFWYNVLAVRSFAICPIKGKFIKGKQCFKNGLFVLEKKPLKNRHMHSKLQTSTLNNPIIIWKDNIIKRTDFDQYTLLDLYQFTRQAWQVSSWYITSNPSSHFWFWTPFIITTFLLFMFIDSCKRN